MGRRMADRWRIGLRFGGMTWGGAEGERGVDGFLVSGSGRRNWGRWSRIYQSGIRVWRVPPEAGGLLAGWPKWRTLRSLFFRDAQQSRRINEKRLN